MAQASGINCIDDGHVGHIAVMPADYVGGILGECSQHYEIV